MTLRINDEAPNFTAETTQCFNGRFKVLQKEVTTMSLQTEVTNTHVLLFLFRTSPLGNQGT